NLGDVALLVDHLLTEDQPRPPPWVQASIYGMRGHISITLSRTHGFVPTSPAPTRSCGSSGASATHTSARHRFARCSPVGRTGGEESTRVDFASVPGSPACPRISKERSSWPRPGADDASLAW